MASQAVQEGISLEEFKDNVLRNAIPKDKNEPDKELERFSLQNLLKSIIEPASYGASAQFEQSYLKRMSQQGLLEGIQPGGFAVPVDVLTPRTPREDRAMRQAGMTFATPSNTSVTTTADAVPRDTYLNRFIPELIARTPILQYATVMRDLRGDVRLPKMTGGLQGGATQPRFVQKGTDQTAQAATFGAVDFTPHELILKFRATRQDIIQTSGYLDEWLRMNALEHMMSAVEGRLLGATVAAESTFDPANISSLISSSAPDHKLTWDDESTINAGRLNREQVLNCQQLVAAQNHQVRDSSTAYFFGKTAYFGLKQVLRGGSASMEYVLENMRVDREFPGIYSNHMVDKTMFFGVWKELIVGFWDTMDIIVDQITEPGNLIVTFMLYMDANARYDTAFVEYSGD